MPTPNHFPPSLVSLDFSHPYPHPSPANARPLQSYEPGGIYRHVSLHTANPVSVVPWGFYSPSVVLGNISGGGSDQQTTDLAQLMPVVDVANGGNTSAAITLDFALLDASGNVAAKANAQEVVAGMLGMGLGIALSSAVGDALHEHPVLAFDGVQKPAPRRGGGVESKNKVRSRSP